MKKPPGTLAWVFTLQVYLRRFCFTSSSVKIRDDSCCIACQTSRAPSALAEAIHRPRFLDTFRAYPNNLAVQKRSSHRKNGEKPDNSHEQFIDPLTECGLEGS